MRSSGSVATEARVRTEVRVRGESVPAYVWLFLAALAFNVFSGQAATLGLPLSLDRPLLLLALVLLYLDPERESLRRRPTHLVFALTVAWTAASWLHTGSLGQSAQAFALLDRIVVPFVMFLVGPIVFSTPARRMLLLRTLAVVGLYLGLTAVFEILGPHSLVFPRAIANPALGIGFGRARGPFLASEPLGMACCLLMVAGGILAASSGGWWQVVGVASAGSCAAAVALSLTRSCWISGILVVALCFAVVPALRRRTPLLLGGVAAVVLLTLTLAPGLVGSFQDRAETSRSVYDRLNTNAAAVRIIDAHPLDGIGWGRYVVESPDWVRQAPTYPVTSIDIEVHDVFLSRAAETGIPGAVLWGLAVLCGPVAVIAWRGRRSPGLQVWRLYAGCALLVWLLPTLFSPNPYPFPNNLIWLICGVAGRDLLVGRQAVVVPIGAHDEH